MENGDLLLKPGGEVVLSLIIVLSSQLEEGFHDFSNALELLNLAIDIKEHHIGGLQGRIELEVLLNSALILANLAKHSRHHLNHEMNSISCVVLLDVLNLRLSLRVFLIRRVELFL